MIGSETNRAVPVSPSFDCRVTRTSSPSITDRATAAGSHPGPILPGMVGSSEVVVADPSQAGGEGEGDDGLRWRATTLIIMLDMLAE